MPAATHRVPVAEAAARLPELIALAEAGEAVSLERGGSVVASLVPYVASPGILEAEPPEAEPTEAERDAALSALCDGFVGMFADASLEEVLSWRHEGHRYA